MLNAKFLTVLLLLLISSCAEFRNLSMHEQIQHYVAETSGQIFIKFNSQGEFLELATFSSIEVEIDHPSALKNAELLAIAEGKKNLLTYFDNEINKEIFFSRLEDAMQDTEASTENNKRKIARKLQEHLIVNKMEIIDSLVVFSSQYDRKTAVLKVTLLSESRINKLWNKFKEAIKEKSF